MDDSDDRLVDRLRELVDRAPVDAEVWTQTEHHVKRNQRRRQSFAAAAVVAVLAVVTLVAVRSTNSPQRVRVAAATASTTTTPATVTAPITTPATFPPTTTPLTTTPAPTTPATTTTTTTPSTTTTSTPPTSEEVCPLDCVGRATADVDGDGRPDQIGLYADPPLSENSTGNTTSKLVIRVVFANGQVAEYDDTAAWDASLVGAADVNGDGRAEIFYFNDTGASLHSGHILRWDGTQLVAVQNADGTPFSLFVDSYAEGGTGVTCSGDSIVSSTIHFDGTSAPGPGPWDGTATTYHWDGNKLIDAGNAPFSFSGDLNGPAPLPAEVGQLEGVHCPGLPAGDPYSTGS